jgi:7,8-dihydropterin-6-yl-methyl-4-(beta-D-ribofuranosyl)aminobenzene 5'-phosphate synthase
LFYFANATVRPKKVCYDSKKSNRGKACKFSSCLIKYSGKKEGITMGKLNRREVLKKGGRFVTGTLVYMALSSSSIFFSSAAKAFSTGEELRKKIEPMDIEKLKITITYDNNNYNKELKSAWGYSCLVEGSNKTILFDTGGDEKILMPNLTALGIDPEQTDLIFISHEHWDHTSGLFKLLNQKSGVNVYIGKSFSSTIIKEIKELGSNPVKVDDPMIVTKNCLSSGEMKSYVKNEQSLFIDTTSGLVVITGCAHPGIVDIVERAKKLTKKDVLIVIGGFHLVNTREEDIRAIVSRLKNMGVCHVASTHCSGPKARKIFKEVYRDNYLNCGVGRIITARDLTGMSL